MKSFYKIVSTAAFAAALLASAPTYAADAKAKDASNVPTRTVSADDLDLAIPTDVQTLYRRVQDAARDVCDESARKGGMERRALLSWRERCYSSAIARAIENAGDQRLTALHRAESERVAELR
jgi:UrcA family protein